MSTKEMVFRILELNSEIMKKEDELRKLRDEREQLRNSVDVEFKEFMKEYEE